MRRLLQRVFAGLKVKDHDDGYCARGQVTEVVAHIKNSVDDLPTNNF